MACRGSVPIANPLRMSLTRHFPFVIQCQLVNVMKSAIENYLGTAFRGVAHLVCLLTEWSRRCSSFVAFAIFSRFNPVNLEYSITTSDQYPADFQLFHIALNMFFSQGG